MRFVSFSVILLLPCLLTAQTDLGRVSSGSTLHVAAIGDYGSGSSHQADVAKAMLRRHQDLPFDLGVTMGDNFYRCGIHSVHDKNWDTRFENMYAPIGVKVFASLGNHDYGHPPVICPGNLGSPDAEVARTAVSSIWRMPARYYTFAAGPVRFFALDTEGWNQQQFEWLKMVLAKSQGEEGVKWRIVYGHHPMYTSGVHLNERRIGALREQLTPVLEENHVDVFLSGHDHDMEHLRKDGIEYLICGASGVELRAVRHSQPESLFHVTTYGFVDFVIDQHKLTFSFFDANLHSLEDPAPILRKD